MIFDGDILRLPELKEVPRSFFLSLVTRGDGGLAKRRHSCLPCEDFSICVVRKSGEYQHWNGVRRKECARQAGSQWGTEYVQLNGETRGQNTKSDYDGRENDTNRKVSRKRREDFTGGRAGAWRIKIRRLPRKKASAGLRQGETLRLDKHRKLLPSRMEGEEDVQGGGTKERTQRPRPKRRGDDREGRGELLSKWGDWKAEDKRARKWESYLQPTWYNRHVCPQDALRPPARSSTFSPSRLTIQTGTSYVFTEVTLRRWRTQPARTEEQKNMRRASEQRYKRWIIIRERNIPKKCVRSNSWTCWAGARAIVPSTERNTPERSRKRNRSGWERGTQNIVQRSLQPQYFELKHIGIFKLLLPTAIYVPISFARFIQKSTENRLQSPEKKESKWTPKITLFCTYITQDLLYKGKKSKI